MAIQTQSTEETGTNLDDLSQLRLPSDTEFKSEIPDPAVQDTMLRELVLEAVQKAASSLGVVGDWDIAELGEVPPQLRRLGNFGFRIIDVKAVEESRAGDENVCAVLFVKSARDPNLLIPIIVPVQTSGLPGHGQNEEIALETRKLVYETFRMDHGYYPYEAIKNSTREALSKWWDGLREKFSKLLFPVGAVLAIGAGWWGWGRSVDSRAASELPGLETVVSMTLADQSKDHTQANEILKDTFISDRGHALTMRLMKHHDESIRLRAVEALKVFFSRNDDYRSGYWGKEDNASILRGRAMELAQSDPSSKVRLAALESVITSLKKDREKYSGGSEDLGWTAILDKVKSLSSEGKDEALRRKAWEGYQELSMKYTNSETNGQTDSAHY